ncbi:MAG: methyltransferase domain-containing protein [Nitrospirota bacterium]
MVDMRWDAEKYDATKAPQIDAGKELIAMAKVRDADSILDIGCGTEKLTIELANLASKGFVVGIDPSKEMLEKVKTVSEEIKNISLVKIPAQLMDFTEAESHSNFRQTIFARNFLITSPVQQ